MNGAQQLIELEREAFGLIGGLLSIASKKTKAAQIDREKMERRLAEARAEIERLVSPPPFKVKDNGAHLYHETASVLVFRNHGSAYWVGMVKKGGAHTVVVTGNLDAAATLKATQEAALSA